MFSDLNKVTCEELSSRLPLEAWFQVFNYLHITEKLHTSHVISEFKEFYSLLQLYYPGYVDNFKNLLVERAACKGLKAYQKEYWTTTNYSPE